MNYFTLINIIFTALFLLGALFFWQQTRKLKNRTVDGGLALPDEYSILSISVPRNNEKTPLAAEQMFAALHGIYRSDTTNQPQVSL
ncbi:MAG: hypothetical protein WD544_02095, partial [Patescibacteria group bacterium]